MMNSDSDDKLDFSPNSSFTKKRPNYVKRRSSRKQDKGQSSSQNFDDSDCAKSIIDVFQKRKDQLPQSKYSAVSTDEPYSANFDYSTDKGRNCSIFYTHKNRKNDVFESKDSNVLSKYKAIDGEDSYSSDHSESGKILLDDHKNILYLPSQLETGDVKCDGSVNTGVTLRHSNMTSTLANNSSILDLSQRSSARGSMFSDNSDPHHTDKNLTGKETPSVLDPNLRTPDHDIDGITRSATSGNKCRSWIVIILFIISFLISCYSSLGCNFLVLDVGFKPKNIEWRQFIDFGPWSFSSSALIEPNNFETRKCLLFPSDFNDKFISADSIWKVSRIVPIISFVLHCIGFIIIFAVSVKSGLIPLSLRCRCLHLKWKKIMTFLTMVILLLESSKFTFFFNTLCKSNLWVADFKTNTKTTAESCEPGLGLHLCIISMLFYFLIFLILCTSPVDVQLR